MKKRFDLVGQKFGRLTVEELLPDSFQGHRCWSCRCECGNVRIAMTHELTQGRVRSCGCAKSPDLTGMVFGRLTVIERSDKRSSRGKRTIPLWKCRCECGEITYRAADTLKTSNECMCSACADKKNIAAARKMAGFVDGTQVSRIREIKPTAANTSGCRGVYYNPKTNRYRARLKFKGRIMSFGTYPTFEEAVQARKDAEKQYFGGFLEELEEMEIEG